MSILKEFREFAIKGNVIDLAVGVIIGAAFSGIVNSLVADIIMPIIGYATGGLDFTNYFLQLGGAPAATYDEAKKTGATVGYGAFLTAALNFLIIAWVLFLAVRGINRLRKKEEEKPAAPPRQEVLLEQIRDLLEKKTA